MRSSFTELFLAIGMPVDAFFQSWEGKNCLAVPLVSVITRVLSYISLQNVSGSPWWSLSGLLLLSGHSDYGNIMLR